MSVNENFNQLKAIQGRKIVFERIFHDGSGAPRDPDNFGIGNNAEPNFVIKNPSGVQIHFGVGDRISEGKYRFTWNTPIDSVVGEGWTIEYGMTISGNYRSQKESFYVIDIADVEDVGAELYEAEQKDSILYYLENSIETYIIEIVSNDGYLVDPNELQVAIIHETSNQVVYGSDSVERISQGKYRIYIPQMSRGDYLLMYKYQMNSNNQAETRVIKIKMVPLISFSMMPELRFQVDKAQKSMDKIQGYTDADLLMAMDLSTAFFNEYPPVSHLASWDLAYNFKSLFITGSIIWALRAQLILEIDLSFSYSGQTISLDYDHKGDISAAISSLMDDYRNLMDKIKMHMALDAASGGSLGYRIYPSANTLIFGDRSIFGSNGTGAGSNAGSTSINNGQQQICAKTSDLFLFEGNNFRSKPSGPQHVDNPIGNPRMFPAIKFH